MASMTFVQSAEVKVKYDGNYSNIEAFNRQFEARLMQRNPLAIQITRQDKEKTNTRTRIQRTIPNDPNARHEK